MSYQKVLRVLTSAFWLLSLFMAFSSQLWASLTPTTTTITFSETNYVWPAPITLTATVLYGGNPATPGLVKFCNASAASCQGSALLGQAQLISNGTATIKVVLPVGSDSVKAVFAGTTTFATSSSATQSIPVSGFHPTNISFGETQTPTGGYTLSSTITGTGSQALAGRVSFVDQTAGAYTFATAPLGASTTSSALVPQTFSGTGSEPIPLAVGDFNGDGIPDLVVGNINPDGSGVYSLTVFLSSGIASYAPATITLPSSFQNPTALAVGDFNNDGNLDIAVVGDNSNETLIFLGSGTGSFIEGETLPTGSGSVPNSIAVGDFNNDGNADLAIANRGTSTVTILLGNGVGDFTAAPQSPATGTSPYFITVGDFNNDGKQDLAVANYNGSNLSIFLGQGDGTFTSAASPNTGVNPEWIAVGDFNGDGNQDLAVTNQFSTAMTILLGNGKGTFTATATPPTTGTNSDSVAVGDFNGDGIQDLAVANSSSNAIVVFFGKGDGTFPKSQSVPASGAAPQSVTTTDFNGDGRQDLAAAGSGNNSVLVAFNTVTTTATAQVTGVTVPGGGTQIVDATYPGDNNYGGSTSATIGFSGTPVPTTLKLAIEPSGALGAGETVQFITNISPVQVGTLLPSGTVSLYNGSSLLANLSVGTGGVNVYNYTVTAAGTDEISAKYSGDSNFGASASTHAITVIAPTPSTTTLTVSSNSVPEGAILTLTAKVTTGGHPVTKGTVVFGDCYTIQNCESPDPTILGVPQLNSNGVASLKITRPIGVHFLHAFFSGTTTVLSSAATEQKVTVTGTFPSTTTLAVSGATGNYALTANVKGDWPPPTGKVSFIDTSNNNAVLATGNLHPGKPSLNQSSVTPVGIAPTAMATGDFNGDGKPDLAVTNNSGNSVSILLNQGNGKFEVLPSAIPNTVLFHSPSGIVAADFNGDGILDLAVANEASSNVTVLLGKGDGTFTLKASYSTGLDPYQLVATDLNGDGKLDLAITNFGSSNVTILLGNGNGTFFVEPDPPVTAATPAGIVATDFDGDGNIDLAVAGFTSQSVTILYGAGDGTFNATPIIPIGTSAAFLVAADFNGDGRPDLAVTNPDQNSVTILLNQGGLGFTLPSPIATGSMPAGIVAADFNGDGQTDLAIANSGGSSLTFLFGSGGGTFTSETKALAGSSDPADLATADLNGDGSPDLTVSDPNKNDVITLLDSTVSTAKVSKIVVPGTGTHEVKAVYGGVAPYTGSTSSAVAVTASQP